MRRGCCFLGLLVGFALVACDEEFQVSEPDAGTAGEAGNGAVGGSAAGGSAGNSTGGVAGAGADAGSGGSRAGAGGSGGEDAACVAGESGCVLDFAGSYGKPGSVDATGKQARFTDLGGITGDSTFLYVTDNHAVRRVAIASGAVDTLVGLAGSDGAVDGSFSVARFGRLGGITTDGQNLWVADQGNQVIRVISLAQQTVATLAGNAGVRGHQDGVRQAALFAEPSGLGFGNQQLYVAETGSHSVRQVGVKDGLVTTLTGNNGAGALDGTPDKAQLNAPQGVWLWSSSSLLIADTGNHRLRTLELAGSHTLTTSAGSTQGHTDAAGALAQFDAPTAIAGNGSALIVADRDNFVIRFVVPPSFDTTTIAGTPQQRGHADGFGTDAAFDSPTDVFYDSKSGDLFILEGTVVRRMF